MAIVQLRGRNRCADVTDVKIRGNGMKTMRLQLSNKMCALRVISAKCRDRVCLNPLACSPKSLKELRRNLAFGEEVVRRIDTQVAEIIWFALVQRNSYVT